MKRRDLLKRIGDAAKLNGMSLELIREGAKHGIYSVGSLEFAVPRHSELNEYTAQAIMKDLAEELGKDWWRR